MGDDALLYCFGQTSRLHCSYICPIELLALPIIASSHSQARFASLLLSKLGVSSTPTFKQGGYLMRQMQECM